jgi:hypothetical protein
MSDGDDREEHFQDFLARYYGELSPEIRALIEPKTLPRDDRGPRIFDVMKACADAGWNNHEVLSLARALCDRWQRYESRNVYEQWTRLLGMLRKIRNPPPEIICAGCGAVCGTRDNPKKTWHGPGGKKTYYCIKVCGGRDPASKSWVR